MGSLTSLKESRTVDVLALDSSDGMGMPPLDCNSPIAEVDDS